MGTGRGCYPEVPLDVPLSSRLPSWCCFVCSVTPPLPLIMMKGPCYLTLFPICLGIYLSVVGEEKSCSLPNLINRLIKGLLAFELGAWTRPWPGGLDSQFFAWFREITLRKEDFVNLFLWGHETKMALCHQWIEFKTEFVRGKLEWVVLKKSQWQNIYHKSVLWVPLHSWEPSSDMSRFLYEIL